MTNDETKASHTPGPHHKHDNGAGVVYIRAGDLILCTMSSLLDGVNNDANADLFASAVATRSSITKIISDIESLQNENDPGNDDAWDLLADIKDELEAVVS